MNQKLTTLLCAVLFLSIQASAQLFSKKFRLPDGKISQKDLCGRKNCEPGPQTIGSDVQKFFKPFYPQVDTSSTTRSVAYQILGKVYMMQTRNQISPRTTCSQQDSNPFTINDIKNFGSTNGRHVVYERKENLKIDINAEVKANIDELLKQDKSATQEQIQRVEAALRLEYNKMASKELLVEAVYTEWGLTDDVLNRLAKKSSDSLLACNNYLSEKERMIITAIGLVTFDVSFGLNSLDAMASAVQAAVEKEGLKASLAASFKRTVNKQLATSSENVYQVLMWKGATASDINNYLHSLSSPVTANK